MRTATRTDWTEAENAALVREYFRLLDAELAGQPLVKAQIIRTLISSPLRGRSRSSIEKKFQNVSALLKNQGQRWVTGYAPLPNFQRRRVPFKKANGQPYLEVHHVRTLALVRAQLYRQVGRLMEEW